MRYVAKVLKTTLAKKFPNATESEIYKASVVFLPHFQDPLLPSGACDPQTDKRTENPML
jgi:hypothetical protein